ncbi:hypothetical protein Ahy_B06g083620 [Arachis hypogaea]|uniref:Uncharacterized protein n=1 Tax=Arachis hypogaea TaxID=3818 RepID=A0A444YQC4_ARAHY|nr:hypothetical protein Ahy_B06g083620 [Arachis hypogaea]
MATIHITLSIHHRGRFERDPVGKVSYIGGEVTEIERVNVDTLNGFFISDLLKDIGYTSISEFYWLEPGKELHDGLKLLRVDMDVVRMYEATMKNGNRINLYTEHPVDQPVVVEIKELTPSKGRRKVCVKRVPTPKKTPRRRLAVVEDDDDAEIVGNVQVEKQVQKSAGPQPMVQAHQENSPAPVATQEPNNISQPPPTPVQPDEPPSTHSQPSQPPLEVEQQPSETHGTDPVPPHEANVSEASQQSWQSDDTDQFIPSQANVSDHIAPEQLTQYIPHPYRNPLSQEIPESAPPFDSNRTPQNNETNPSDEAEEDFSDDNDGYHCYESEDLRSIPSDEDSDETTAFSQSNADAPVSQVRLKVGMEFETLSQFRKAVQKFNINIGRSIFFARCDSTRSKAICYDEDCPWQIYCAKRTFPASYQVKTFVNEHTCSRDNHCKLADGAYNAAYQTSMRPVPSQEFWEHADTLPILPPRYKKPIGRPSMKRDKRNDAPKDKSDPHRTKRSIGTIVCKYCLQAGHNKQSCKKRKEAMGEGSAAPQVPASDEDEDMLAEMYYEETLEAAEAEAAATEMENGSTAAQTSQGASAGTTTRFVQFMPTMDADGISRTRGIDVRGRGEGRGRGRRGASSRAKNGISSGSSNSIPMS